MFIYPKVIDVRDFVSDTFFFVSNTNKLALSSLNRIFALLLLPSYADALIHLFGLRWLGGDDIVERRLLGALVLTLLELRNF